MISIIGTLRHLPPDNFFCLNVSFASLKSVIKDTSLNWVLADIQMNADLFLMTSVKRCCGHSLLIPQKAKHK